MIVVAAFTLVIAAILFWRAHQSTEFLTGNSISLLDHFQTSYIVRTKLNAVTMQISGMRLKYRWRRLSSDPSGSIWTTLIDQFIANDRVHLYRNGSEVTMNPDFFQSEIQPGQFSFFQNQIFLSVPNGSDPNEMHFSMDYETYPDLIRQRIHNEVPTRIFSIDETHQIFPLQHELFLNNADSPDVVLHRNGKPYSSEWRYAFAREDFLFQSSVLGMFKMFGKSDVVRQDFYAPSGLTEFTITAAGEMAGTEAPVLGVYVDRKKIGTVSVTNSQNSNYTVTTPILDGKHHFELVFENDFYDPVTHQDRNINVKEVRMQYLPALIVNSSSDPSRYTVDYWTSNFDSKDYYSQFVLERERNNEWLNRVTTSFPLNDELRRSLVLGSGDRTEFPLSVPDFASLDFGYGGEPGAEQGNRLTLKVKRAFHSPVVLFSEEIQKRNSWKDVHLDLSRFAGQKIHLSFENFSRDPRSDIPSLVFISNPRISSDHASKSSAKLIVLFSFDALRADHLGAYGYQQSTSPNIDSFVQSAVLFENVYTSETWTLSSFASLFTSVAPSFHNVREPNQSLSRKLDTLPLLLQRNGFCTIAFVSNPLLHPLYGFGRGFESYNYHQGSAIERTNAVLDWLRNPPPQKTFLFIHLINPHTPYTAPKEILQRLGDTETEEAHRAAYLNISNRKGCSEIAEKDLQDLILQYDAEILQGDELFQKIMDRLKEMQLYDDATIILMSDHGEEFMDHGGLWHGANAFYETAKVPLIIKLPRKYNIKPKRIVERTQLLDVMPTILHLAAVQIPSQAQGSSVLALIKSIDRQPSADRNLFTENRNGIIGVIHNRYRFIYTDPTISSCESHRTEELYDLDTDPTERHDLSSLHPEILKTFQLPLFNYISTAKAFRERQSERPVEPSEAMKEQFRALGYMH